MSDQQYYRILLDDYSAASFTSFDKAYFGTMSDLEGWIKAIEVEKCFAERFSSLTKTFRAYQSGQHNITHNVAYQEVRFLDTCLASKLTNIELSDICPLAKAGQPFEVARENTCEECKYFCRIHYEVDPEYGDKQVHFWMNEEIVTFF